MASGETFSSQQEVSIVGSPFHPFDPFDPFSPLVQVVLVVLVVLVVPVVPVVLLPASRKQQKNRRHLFQPTEVLPLPFTDGPHLYSFAGTGEIGGHTQSGGGI